MSTLRAACLLLGVPLLGLNWLGSNAQLVAAINTDGRDPNSLPKLDIPPPPEFEDVDHPEFEPYPVDVDELLDGAMLEQFDGNPSDVLTQRWSVISGDWAVEEPVEFRGFAHDQGLVLKSEQLHCAIVRKTPQILDTTSGTKPFVVQYEVKTQQPLRCGGAYIKLLPPTDEQNASDLTLNADTQYVVMFGPDRCGNTDKVHFIITDRQGREHHLVQPPRTHHGLLSSLYTLIISPDQTFEIRRDGTVLRAGSLLDEAEFDPPLVPAAEIDDPNDSKPDDWVDAEYIPDPNETQKPEDWDENEPHLIPDPDAVKPEGWHDDWPLHIADPKAEKPAEWDDEDDGEWKPPTILNPQCEALDLESGLEGCGEWLAPLVRNPKWRGKWAQPQIPNPEYVGEWKPRKIANPAFEGENLTPNRLSANIGGVGYELLTVQGNILFDNLYVGHSVRDAENIGNATWSPKYYIEAESQGRAADARRRQLDEKAERERKSDYDFSLSLSERVRLVASLYADEYEDFKLAPRRYLEDTYNDFISLFRIDKVSAMKAYPVTSVVFGVAIAAITSLAFALFNSLLFVVTGRQMPQADARRRANANANASAKAAEAKVVNVPEVKVPEVKVAAVNVPAVNVPEVNEPITEVRITETEYN